MIGAVRWFLYQRADTLGGAGNVIAWKANQDNKHQIYSELRDSIKAPSSPTNISMPRIEIRSINLVQQLQAIIEDDGWLGAGPDTGENDDLVSAMTLAHHVYIKWRRPAMVAQGITWESIKGERPRGDPATVLSFAVSEHWAAINRKARVRRESF